MPDDFASVITSPWTCKWMKLQIFLMTSVCAYSVLPRRRSPTPLSMAKPNRLPFNSLRMPAQFVSWLVMMVSGSTRVRRLTAWGWRACKSLRIDSRGGRKNGTGNARRGWLIPVLLGHRQRKSPGWSGLRQRHSSCLWFQMLGVEAHSLLPHNQHDGGNPRCGQVGKEVVQCQRLAGGGGGIRTPEALSSLTVFKTAGFNRSPTPPFLIVAYSMTLTTFSAGYRVHSDPVQL